jgi:LysR family transcriptional regulator, cyn operon transcriptional activator
MDLRKLEIFLRVAQLNNFSRAAESLHMAQPAVSIAIRKLEESLQTRLFDRGARQVTLTAEGRYLRERAQAILRDIDELSASVNAMNKLLSGELTLACPSMLATYFLPDLLSGFLGIHPGLKASVTQAGTARVEQMLLDEEIEIGVISSAPGPASTELELTPLISDEMVLCVAQNHPWAGREVVDIAELHESQMVLYESGYFVRARLDQLCADHGIKPDIRMQSNFLPLLVKMVNEGLGSTVGLKMMGDNEPAMVGISLQPTTTVDMALAKRRGRTISRANQAFLDWVAFTL